MCATSFIRVPAA